MSKKIIKRAFAALLVLVLTVSMVIPEFPSIKSVEAAATKSISADVEGNILTNPEFDDVATFPVGDDTPNQWYMAQVSTATRYSGDTYYGANSMMVTGRSYYTSRPTYRIGAENLKYDTEYYIQGAVSAYAMTNLKLCLGIWGYNPDPNHGWQYVELPVDTGIVEEYTWDVLAGTFRLEAYDSPEFPGYYNIRLYVGSEMLTIYGVESLHNVTISVYETTDPGYYTDLYLDSFVVREQHLNKTETDSDVENLIINSGFELNDFATTYTMDKWYPTYSTIEQYSGTSHSGTHSLRVSNRTANWHRAEYWVDGSKFEYGRQYNLSGYVLSELPADVELVVEILGDVGTDAHPGQYMTLTSGTAGMAGWTKLEGSFAIRKTVNAMDPTKYDFILFVGGNKAVLEGVNDLHAVQIMVQEAYHTNTDCPDLYLDSFTLKAGTVDRYIADEIFEERTQIDASENDTEPVWFTSLMERLNGEQVSSNQTMAEFSEYSQTFFVSDYVGKDTNDGTEEKPFKTIEHAKEVVRQAKTQQSGDIAVVLREGTYTLSSKLCFDENDSGTNGYDIVWMSYPGEVVKISGGQEITGWTNTSGNIWSVQTDLAKVDSLYVDDVKADLASSGSTPLTLNSYDKTNKRIVVNAGDLGSVTAGASVMLYQDWQTNIIPINSIEINSENGEEAYIYFTDEISDLFYREDLTQESLFTECTKYVLQNHYSLLDEPGEFYYDKSTQTLYYIPRDGQDMTSASVSTPAFDGLVQVQGSNENSHVQNLVFKGLVFEYSGFDNKAGWDAFMEYQASHYYVKDNNDLHPNMDVPTATIHVQNADNIDIERCVIRHSGGNGINFYNSVYDSNMDGCALKDIAATGVMSGVFAWKLNDPIFGKLYLPDDPEQTAVHNVNITNNALSWIGTQYKGACGIANILGYEMLIRNNEVGYVAGMGISNGWGWSLEDYVVKENTIAYNDIHHIGMATMDIGGIYNLNAQRGTQIRNNYIHDIQESTTGRYDAPVCPIYLDDGTNWIVVADNTVLNNYNNVSSQPYYTHTEGTYYLVENNDTGNTSVMKSAGVGKAYASLSLKQASDIGDSVIQNVSLGQPKNTITGEVGMKIVPTQDVDIAAIGRFWYYTNTDVHELKIYDANNNIVAAAQVDMSKGTADKNGFKYAKLDAPITLTAKTTYYVVSTETRGSDMWMNGNDSTRKGICNTISNSVLPVKAAVIRAQGSDTFEQVSAITSTYGYVSGPVNLLIENDGPVLTVGGVVNGVDTYTDPIYIRIEDGQTLPTGYVEDKYIFSWECNGESATIFNEANGEESYIADFVDKKMLAVKKQDNSATLGAEATKLKMRFIGSVNSLVYDKAGFVFSLKNPDPAVHKETCVTRDTTIVYKNLKADGIEKHVNDVYDLYSTYMFAFSMNNIPVDTVIYVRSFVKLGDIYVYGDTRAVTVTNPSNIEVPNP